MSLVGNADSTTAAAATASATTTITAAKLLAQKDGEARRSAAFIKLREAAEAAAEGLASEEQDTEEGAAARLALVNDIRTSLQETTDTGVLIALGKMAGKTATCGTFVYGGDSSTLGRRWGMWLERWKLVVVARKLQDDDCTRADFLLMVGEDAYSVYKTLGVADGKTLEEMYDIFTKQFVVKRSTFSEQQVFRRAFRHEGELVEHYHMRLRSLAAHCGFDKDLEDQIMAQLVAGIGMPEFQTRCCRKDGLTLAKALELAKGFERTTEDFRELTLQSTQASQRRSINYASTPASPACSRTTKQQA